jgi:hypothetical protein
MKPDIRTVAAFAFIALAASANAQAPHEPLQQMVEQLRKSPDDIVLREKIIKLGTTFKPVPAIPEEARRAFVEGVTIVKVAKDEASQRLAVDSFNEAVKLAPWWSDAYYNLAVAQELAGQLDAAERTLKWFMLSTSREAETREAQDRIYAIGAKRKVAAAQAAAGQEREHSPDVQATRKIQQDQALIRSLNGVRFDSPASLSMPGSSEYCEHWLVISGNALTIWDKVTQADPELAAASPRSHALGAVSHATFSITGTLARGSGAEQNTTFQINADRIDLSTQGKLFRTYHRR